MTALMGPSGSGKTTLLDVMAGRKTAGVTEGELFFSGSKPSRQFLRKYTGYVEQFDTLIGVLTVEEMLMYTAELKRPMSEGRASKQSAVHTILKKLSLETCRDVKIGNALSKGISGGQAKRTNIGIALITNPRVLFLDEPTSGLDSYTANEVMTFVRHLTQDGTTIVVTIHSPTQYVFDLFDSLAMLLRGSLIYWGPMSTAVQAITEFCPKGIKEHEGYSNDAEYLVDLTTEADHANRSQEIAVNYKASALKQRIDEKLLTFTSEQSRLVVASNIQAELETKTSTVTPWYYGLWILTKYKTLKDYQTGEFLGPRIGVFMVIGLVIMTLYLNVGNDFSPANLPNIPAILYMGFCVMMAYGAVLVMPSILLERALFIRERSDGLYHVFTYVLAKAIEEIIVGAAITAVVSAFNFYGIKFQGDWVFFWLIYFVTWDIGIVLGYLVASLSPNLDAASALYPAYVTTLVFFGGFIIRPSDMPPWWYWYSRIDFLTYAYGSFMVNQFGGNDPPFQGTTMLQFYSLDHVNKWAYLGYLSLFYLVFFVLTWLALSYVNHSKR